jgi:hypothetical protein
LQASGKRLPGPVWGLWRVFFRAAKARLEGMPESAIAGRSVDNFDAADASEQAAAGFPAVPAVPAVKFRSWASSAACRQGA